MLEGKHIVMLAEDDFEDSELMEPLRALKDAGARVIVVGSGSKIKYKGKRGRATLAAETTADKVDIDGVDAVIVPGGDAPDRMRLYQPMVDLIKKAHHFGKLIAAICRGPQLLISADVIRGVMLPHGRLSP